MSINRWLSREYKPMDGSSSTLCPDERRTERGRQVDALRFAAGKGRRQAIERQVVEADVLRNDNAAILQHLSAIAASFGELQRSENSCASCTVSEDTRSIVRPAT
jgi:hypothetical protein